MARLADLLPMIDPDNVVLRLWFVRRVGTFVFDVCYVFFYFAVCFLIMFTSLHEMSVCFDLGWKLRTLGMLAVECKPKLVSNYNCLCFMV